MLSKIKYLSLQCFIAAVLGGISVHANAVPAVSAAPDEIQTLISQGMNLIDYQVADLNADGRNDALIVVAQDNVNDTFAETPRTVILLIRNANGELQIAEKNDQVYLCNRCLGSRDDKEQVVVTTKGGFSIENYGGSPRYRSYKKFTFKYIKTNKTWILSKVETSISDEVLNNNKFKNKKFYYPKNLKLQKFSNFKINDKWIAKF
jgi:hypothetical protein